MSLASDYSIWTAVRPADWRSADCWSADLDSVSVASPAPSPLPATSGPFRDQSRWTRECQSMISCRYSTGQICAARHRCCSAAAGSFAVSSDSPWSRMHSDRPPSVRSGSSFRSWAPSETPRSRCRVSGSCSRRQLAVSPLRSAFSSLRASCESAESDWRSRPRPAPNCHWTAAGPGRAAGSVQAAIDPVARPSSSASSCPACGCSLDNRPDRSSRPHWSTHCPLRSARARSSCSWSLTVSQS